MVLLWVAWAGGLSRAWLITIGLTAGILFAVYLPGMPTGQLDHLMDRTALPKLADYYVRLLGLPWSHTSSLVWLGRLIGCMVLGASIVTLFRSRTLRRPVGRLERMGLALLMFSLLITAVVAVGRWNWAPDTPVSIRYGIFAALAQAGLLLANTPWLNWVWQKGHRRPFEWATLVARDGVAGPAGRRGPGGGRRHHSIQGFLPGIRRRARDRCAGPACLPGLCR